MFFKDATGKDIDVKDLSKLNTVEIHELLVDKGLERSAAGAKDISRKARDIMQKVKLNKGGVGMD